MSTNDSLYSYISEQRSKGKNDEEIKNALIQVGWATDIVTNALNGNIDTPPLPPTVDTSNHTNANTTMWDAFKHILMFITMGVFVISITLTFHIFIDRVVPKELLLKYAYDTYDWQTSYQNMMLKGYASAIIVSFPIFAYLFINIQQSTIKNPEIKKLKSRKILTYLTLIISFLFIISNLTHLVYKFLDGNTGLNFLAHIICTLSVSGIIFSYFLKQVRDDKK